MKLIYKLFSVLLIMVVLGSCKRENVDVLGPAYISAPDGFAVNSFTAKTAQSGKVNLRTDKVIFNATFSSSVTWKLTIVGQKSGAIFEEDGISNSINNLEWTGKQTGVAFFRKGENTIATLSFMGSKLTSSISIVLLDVPNYRTCGLAIAKGDFETDLSNWHPFNLTTPPIPNVIQGVDSMMVDYKGNIVRAIQGTQYYYIKGKGAQSVFVSGISYSNNKIITGAMTLPANPDSVWLNIYMYGTGDANSSVELKCQEEDANGQTPGYSETDDDAYVATVTLNHIGWKLFSFRYSTLQASTTLDLGGRGNKMREPDKIVTFVVALTKKSNPDSPVEVYFDYPIFTKGGPFKPCK